MVIFAEVSVCSGSINSYLIQVSEREIGSLSLQFAMCTKPQPVVRGQNPRVNGFALILTNDYTAMNGALPPLHGPLVDGRKMRETIELLNFETHWEHNATASVTRGLVRETSRCKYLPNYKRLAFIFSGHGTTKHNLCTQDVTFTIL